MVRLALLLASEERQLQVNRERIKRMKFISRSTKSGLTNNSRTCKNFENAEIGFVTSAVRVLNGHSFIRSSFLAIVYRQRPF